MDSELWGEICCLQKMIDLCSLFQLHAYEIIWNSHVPKYGLEREGLVQEISELPYFFKLYFSDGRHTLC